MNLTTWIQGILLVTVEAVGTILFKIGVDKTQMITFSDPVTIALVQANILKSMSGTKICY